MFINNLNPVFIDIGFLEIRWYSLAYIFGLIFAIIYSKFLIKKLKLNFDINIIDNFIPYSIIGIILGGRLGYVLFYNPIYYLENYSEIFKIWQGGMSFHGGLLGVIIATIFFIIFCNKNKINFLNFSDILSVLTPCGLFLGRVANFINSELIGRPTELPWSVVFIKIDNVPRHPSQIYEAILEGIVLFIILNIFFKNKYLKKGITSAFFLIFYGLFRLIAEQFREPDKHIGYIFNFISLGSLLSIAMIIFAFIFVSKINPNEKSK